MQYQYLTTEIPTDSGPPDTQKKTAAMTLRSQNGGSSQKYKVSPSIPQNPIDRKKRQRDLDDLFGHTGRNLESFLNHSQWVAWRDDGPKAKKIPYNPHYLATAPHHKASSSDPATWGTRAEARRRERVLLKRGDTGGVGIVLGKIRGEAELAIGGVDLDSCIHPATGEVRPWAKEVIDRFSSYAEVSPSGSGIKVFFLYNPEDLPKIRAVMETEHGKSFSIGEHCEIALHVSNRYFTVTGKKTNDAPQELQHVALDDLLWLIEVAGPAFKRAGNQTKASGKIDRSAKAYGLAIITRRDGKDFAEFRQALLADPEVADWANDKRQVRRAWDRSEDDAEDEIDLADEFDDLPDDEGERRKATKLIRGANKLPISNLANALTILRTDRVLVNLVAFDEMTQCAMLLRPVPTIRESREPDMRFKRRALRDSDVAGIQEYLQRAGLSGIAETTTHSAVTRVAEENAFHPVRDWLRSLRWDQEPRIDNWLVDYMGAEGCEYVNHVGRLFLIQMVARVMRAGCKADHMMVLEGIQGIGKSGACAVLAGGHFSDSLPDLSTGKEAMAHLKGRWLIEVGEMSALRKSEVEDIKHFITKSEDTYRPSYGRLDVTIKRQCVFVGTTNASSYLRDETGGRRFWPVACGAVSIEALQRDRDQLFAEAFAAFAAGEAWWPDKRFEADHVAPQQEMRFESDPWEECISAYLDHDFDDETRDRVTLNELGSLAIGLDMERFGQLQKRRIAAVLMRLGWQPNKSNGARSYIRVPKQSKRRGLRR